MTNELRPAAFRGRAGYALDLPNGTYHIFKRGAYWYYVVPGDTCGPGPKDYSGLNTRNAAVSMAHHHSRYNRVCSWCGKTGYQDPELGGYCSAECHRHGQGDHTG